MIDANRSPATDHAGRRPPLLPRAALVAPLVAIYCVVLVSVDPWDIAIGAVLGFGLLVVAARFAPVQATSSLTSLTGRLAAFPAFAFAIAREIVVGTIQVAAIVLGRRPLRQPGIVAVPIGDRTPVGVAVSALASTLSPGSLLVEVDWTAGEMLIHVIDATDPERVRADHARFYERYQRHVFP